jgi:CRISPR-associated protein Cas1
MSTLYVTEAGVQVHKEGQRLLVKKGQTVLQDIPMIKVDRVVLMGKGASITTPTLFALANHQVGVYYLSSRGRFILRTAGNEHRHSQVRRAQALATNDPARAMAIARSIVSGKIHNQRVLVQRHAEGSYWARQALAQMDAMGKRIDNAQSLDELRGYEGNAARDYFHLIRQLLHPPGEGRSWGFDRRAYYPPTDPINALLSFGYTLLLNDLVAGCQLAGLDPALGFFHAIDYNKPALALDLEEEFRPIVVDSIVLAAINRPILGWQDFEVGQLPQHDDEEENPLLRSVAPRKMTPPSDQPALRPIYLKEMARKKFIDMYETRLNEQIFYPASGEQTSYRRIFELQAYAMARIVLGEASHYTPFMVR